MAKKKDIIEEAVEEAHKVKATALESAKGVIADAMSNRLKETVSRAINEELGAGGDPPSDYDEDGEQKRSGDNQPAVGDTGDDLSDEGDGPAVIEAGLEEDDFLDDDDMDYEDDDDLDMGYEEEDDDDLDMDIDDEEDDVIEIVEDDITEMGDDEEDIDFGDDEPEDDFEETALTRENKRLKAYAKKQSSRITQLETALGTMRDHIKEVNLFNARLAGVSRIMGEVTMTKFEKDRLIDKFDDCESVNEVKRTYKALKEAYRSSNRVRKHRVSRPNVPSVRSTLNESAGSEFSRMSEIAGL